MTHERLPGRALPERCRYGCVQGTVAQALRLTLQLIKADKTNAEAYAIRGMALFLSADYDQGLKHLKESLRLDPDARSATMPNHPRQPRDSSLFSMCFRPRDMADDDDDDDNQQVKPDAS